MPSEGSAGSRDGSGGGGGPTSDAWGSCIEVGTATANGSELGFVANTGDADGFAGRSEPSYGDVNKYFQVLSIKIDPWFPYLNKKLVKQSNSGSA